MRPQETEPTPFQSVPLGIYTAHPSGDLEASNSMNEDSWKVTNEPYNADKGMPPKQQLHLLPGARIEPRPYVHRYFLHRPQLLQYFEQGELVDSHGRRLGSTSVNELGLSRSAEGGRGEDGSVSDVHEHLVEADSDKSKIQRSGCAEAHFRSGGALIGMQTG